MTKPNQNPHASRSRNFQRSFPDVLLRLGLLTFFWFVLSGGETREPAFAAVAIVLTVILSLWLWPPHSWPLRALEILRFFPWFCWHSLLGGWDVALRAMRRDMGLDPTIHRFSCDLPPHGRCILAWTISLLPGTACVFIREKDMEIHLLNRKSADSLRELEKRIERLLKKPTGPE